MTGGTRELNEIVRSGRDMRIDPRRRPSTRMRMPPDRSDQRTTDRTRGHKPADDDTSSHQTIILAPRQERKQTASKKPALLNGRCRVGRGERWAACLGQIRERLRALSADPDLSQERPETAPDNADLYGCDFVLYRLLTPERERQQAGMVAALSRVIDLLR
jgi:hypothetical protein